jgi:hypothetical protein
MKRLETVAFVALILTGVAAVSLAQSDDVASWDWRRRRESLAA